MCALKQRKMHGLQQRRVGMQMTTRTRSTRLIVSWLLAEPPMTWSCPLGKAPRLMKSAIMVYMTEGALSVRPVKSVVHLEMIMASM